MHPRQSEFAALLASVSAAACMSSMNVPADAQLTCGSGTDCPDDRVCIQSACISKESPCISLVGAEVTAEPDGLPCSAPDNSRGICVRGTCRASVCGDGILDPDQGEGCDDGAGNADAADNCRTDCSLPKCGDGIINRGETCDDEELPLATCNSCAMLCDRLRADRNLRSEDGCESVPSYVWTYEDPDDFLVELAYDGEFVYFVTGGDGRASLDISRIEPTTREHEVLDSIDILTDYDRVRDLTIDDGLLYFIFERSEEESLLERVPTGGGPRETLSTRVAAYALTSSEFVVGNSDGFYAAPKNDPGARRTVYEFPNDPNGEKSVIDLAVVGTQIAWLAFDGRLYAIDLARPMEPSVKSLRQTAEVSPLVGDTDSVYWATKAGDVFRWHVGEAEASRIARFPEPHIGLLPEHVTLQAGRLYATVRNGCGSHPEHRLIDRWRASTA